MRIARRIFLYCLFLPALTGCFLVQKNREGKGERCTLHDTRLHKTIVPLSYGFFCCPRCRLGKGAENFPNAKHWECGGCVVTMRKFSEQYVCRKCQRAKRKYDRLHRHDPEMKIRAAF